MVVPAADLFSNSCTALEEAKSNSNKQEDDD
jgi:hypothetical protein